MTRNIVAVLMVALIFTGCTNYEKKTTRHGKNQGKTEGNTAAVKKSKTRFGSMYTATYNTGKILKIEVDHSESASINKVNITSNDFKEPVSITMETEPVSDVFMADLDKNGLEEVYLVTISAGSGSYGMVYAFITGVSEKIIQSYIAENETQNETIFEGYMGHDKFYVENALLVREFPVYKENDTNANPTGGKRKVFYTLSNNELKVLSSEKG